MVVRGLMLLRGLVVMFRQGLNIIIDTLKPTGLSMRGGEEEKVGYKSFEDLDEVFDLLAI